MNNINLNYSDESESSGGESARSAQGVHGQNATLIGDYGRQKNFFGGTHSHGVTAVSWPVTIGRAPLQAAAFQSRPRLDDRLYGPAGSDDTQRTVVLSGDAGTGKTQMAAAWFRQALESGIDLAVWIVAASRANVLSSYQETYAALNPAYAATAQIDEHVAVRLLAWLAATHRRWVVVLDDLADPLLMHQLWPAGPAGNTLVTTRRRDAALTARGKLIGVGVFEEQESISYLSARLLDGGLPRTALTEMTQLAGDLGHLPLALAQASAVILNAANSCADYRTALADRHRTLRDVFPLDPNVSGDEYGQAVSAAWSLAVDRATAMQPLGLARPLLNLIACMDPNGVPEAAITSLAARRYISESTAAADLDTVAAPSDIQRALRNLHLLSLVIHDPMDQIRTVRMHALAQRATLENLAAPDYSSAVRSAADSLLETWPGEGVNRRVAQIFRANTSALAIRDADALWQPVFHQILFRSGQSLGETGLVVSARQYFGQLAETARNRLGDEHPQTLESRHQLAWWSGAAGDVAGAAAAFESLIAAELRVLGRDDLRTFASRTCQAYWQGEAGDPAGAVRAFERLLVDELKFLGPRDLQTLATRINLAYWRGEAGNPAAAAAATEELLDDIVGAYGPAHPETLAIRNNLAYWRGHAGDKAGAAAATEELVSELIVALGEEHPDTLAARNSLAWWRGEAGNPVAAVNACDNLLGTMVAILGDEHVETLATRNTRAWWQGAAGDADGAARAFDELLADRIRVLGADHLHALYTRQNLGAWRGRAGDSSGALAMYGELLRDCLRVVGPEHPFTKATWNNCRYWAEVSGLGLAVILEGTNFRPDLPSGEPAGGAVVGPSHWQKRPRPKLFGMSTGAAWTQRQN
jgi:hypothetical protein